ncbi:hypothetical protein MKX01_040313 [Papaver californicum]|nr:hypothetical protein MKX01_040313 [Papaver californicum]
MLAKYPIPNFNSALFSYAPDVDLLTLYLDCFNLNLLDQFPFRFSCQINDTGASITPSSDAYLYFNMAIDTLGIPTLDFSSCRKSVIEPVMHAALGDLTTKPETLHTAIKQVSVCHISSLKV